MTKLQTLLWRFGFGDARWFRRWVGGLWVQRIHSAFPAGLWFHVESFDGPGSVLRVDDLRRAQRQGR